MRKILLVEDDEQFRSVVKNLLIKNFEVIEAANGKIARDLLALVPVDLILSDIQMPFLTGVDLLEWVKKNKPTPMILITGFSHILETQQAYELGADEFIAKPFGEQELMEKVHRVLGELTPEHHEEAKPLPPPCLDKEFCKINIEDFIAEKEMDYGIYLRMSPIKYIKLAHKGGKFSEEKIRAFKEKGVTHLYIRRDDFAKLVGFTILVSKAVSNSEKVDHDKKLRFMKYTGEMIVQQAYVAGADEVIFQNAKDFLCTSMDVLTEDKETFSLLSLLSDYNDFLYAHSLGVSMFSVMIAKQLGWQSSQTLFKLAFAGLFHDIGKKEIPLAILEKSRSTLTQNERALLETHTARGCEILQSLKTAPTEVIRVAYEHHEDVLGQGFPQGLRKIHIHPFSLVVAVADTFCEYTIRNPHNPSPMTAPEAIQAMKTYKIQFLDTLAFEALTRAVAGMKKAS